MFLWDFVADKVMGQIVDWIYSKLLEFLGEFFGMMGSMGADLFDYDFVRAIIELFRLFGWALFVSGMVVAVFEIAVEYQSGRGSIKDACLNAMKGFMAVSIAYLFADYDGLFHYQSVLRKSKKRRYPFSNDCSRIALYVFNCAWLYRWLYSMVQADHRYMSYCIFTGSHFNCRSGCYERKLSFRNRLDTGSK